MTDKAPQVVSNKPDEYTLGSGFAAWVDLTGNPFDTPSPSTVFAVALIELARRHGVDASHGLKFFPLGKRARTPAEEPLWALEGIHTYVCLPSWNFGGIDPADALDRALYDSHPEIEILEVGDLEN